ncbi:hypothetical protein EVAR_98840_1 [Eumeta japonica]|uniref:Uncharacterized protein n=1 Tax=Eumeta variegata TaxID=151549 RepID=A0A4C1YNI0_EUMVA|nr:hypothetical protein EVAR_98840_1 [Eumeta japonica]
MPLAIQRNDRANSSPKDALRLRHGHEDRAPQIFIRVCLKVVTAPSTACAARQRHVIIKGSFLRERRSVDHKLPRSVSTTREMADEF